MQQQVGHALVHWKPPASLWADQGALLQNKLQQGVMEHPQELLIVLQHALCHLRWQI